MFTLGEINKTKACHICSGQMLPPVDFGVIHRRDFRYDSIEAAIPLKKF